MQIRRQQVAACAAAILFCLVAGSDLANAAEFRTVTVNGAPFTVVRAELHASDGEVVVTVENTSEQSLHDLFVVAKVFSAGARVSGWLSGRKLALEPGQSAELRHTPQQRVSDDQIVVLAPFAAHARDAAGDGASWSLKAALLKQLAPSSSDKPLEAAAGTLKPAVPVPDLAGTCCENCSTASHSCGDNFLRGSCRSSACIASYHCQANVNPASGAELCECDFSCRNPESCC